jgi:signal peptidase II
LSLSVFFANFVIDRLTKITAIALLKKHEPLSLLRGLVIFTYTENPGAFLSLGAQWPAALKYAALLIVPILICAAALLYLMLKEKKLYRVIAGSCVSGGGIGNLLDRLCNDFRVIDCMRRVHTPPLWGVKKGMYPETNTLPKQHTSRLCREVVDFMNFGIGPLRTGILNAADLSVTFGVLALLLFEIKGNTPKVKSDSRLP